MHCVCELKCCDTDYRYNSARNIKLGACLLADYSDKEQGDKYDRLYQRCTCKAYRNCGVLGNKSHGVRQLGACVKQHTLAVLAHKALEVKRRQQTDSQHDKRKIQYYR